MFCRVSPFISPPFSDVQELAGKERAIAHHRHEHRPTRPTVVSLPCAGHVTPGGSYGLFTKGRAYSHLCVTAHAPLGQEGLPFHSFLPPWDGAHPAYARTLFFLVDQYELLHPVMVTQLLEMSSQENTVADSPVAHHHDALARRAWHRRQCRLLRPSPGIASR